MSIAPYSPRFRAIEIASLLIFAILFAAIGVRVLASADWRSVIELAVVVVAAAVSADVICGVVHWAADTWGDQTWPVVGPTLIRSFREHHVDQHAITTHDFIEANGATALVLLPTMIAVYVLMPDAAAWPRAYHVGVMYVLSLSALVLMTNQIHKWAHTPRPPAVIRGLQRLGVLMSAEHHRAHHHGAHTVRYCITTGWMNPILDRWRFFRTAEGAIQAISGLQPREDDLHLTGWHVAAQPEPPAPGPTHGHPGD